MAGKALKASGKVLGTAQPCAGFPYTASTFSYFSSGCCPSCAFHAHSVIFISVNTALKLDSSGLQA